MEPMSLPERTAMVRDDCQKSRSKAKLGRAIRVNTFKNNGTTLKQGLVNSLILYSSNRHVTARRQNITKVGGPLESFTIGANRLDLSCLGLTLCWGEPRGLPVSPRICTITRRYFKIHALYYVR